LLGFFLVTEGRFPSALRALVIQPGLFSAPTAEKGEFFYLPEGARRIPKHLTIGVPVTAGLELRNRYSGCDSNCSSLFLGVDSQKDDLWGKSVRSTVKCVAVVCLLLTLWSAVAFAAHHHAKGTGSANCTVCIAAHTAAPGPSTHLHSAALSPVFIVEAVPLSQKGRFIAFALSVRPPPAS
jgi:hypothetical protein